MGHILPLNNIDVSGDFFQAQFDASEMITQREVVSHKVRQALTNRAQTFSILLDDISLVSRNDGKSTSTILFKVQWQA